MNELRRVLGTINTHHSEHHLLRRFISDLPRSLTRPSVENNAVRTLDNFRHVPNRHTDDLGLITAAILGEELDSEALIKKIDDADTFKTDEEGSIYSYVASTGEARVRIQASHSKSEFASEVKELVLPTVIPGVVLGFSGLGVSKLNDMRGSTLQMTFYSVPMPSIPEQ
jgi:hypothetical protein